jgi:hypothetical protein
MDPLHERVIARHLGKTAAHLDVYKKWREIVQKHDEAEKKELQALLHELVNYLKSVGYDLNVNRSHIGKANHGSDGARLYGQLVVKERDENVSKAQRPEQVSSWVQMATGLSGSAHPLGDGEWSVDISDY